MSSFDEIRRQAAEVNASMERYSKSRASMIQKMALSYIDPRSQSPFIFPSFAPVRTGAATFPLVFGLRAGVDVPSEGALIVSPTLTPALYSTTAEYPYSTETVYTNWTYNPWHTQGPSYNWKDVTWSRGDGSVQALHTYGGYPAFELYAKDLPGTSFVNYNMTRTRSDPSTKVELFLWNSDSNSWYATGSILSDTAGVVNTLTLANYGTGPYTAFRLQATADGPPACSDDVEVLLWIVPSGVELTCSPPTPNSFVMAPETPDWDSLFSDSEWFRVVAVSALVTYEGPLLTNGGSMGVCNTDEDLIPTTTWYNAVTSQPFDVYKGRLAPMGASPGGGHWHYLPSTVNEFSLLQQDYEGCKGVFAWSGFTDGILRVQIDIVVNFHSKKPQYSMSIPPPFDGISSALYLLRKEIPLVSSNDTHTEKITKHLKRVLTNLDKVDPYAAARVMSEVARISSAVALMAGQPQYSVPLGVVSKSLQNMSKAAPGVLLPEGCFY